MSEQPDGGSRLQRKPPDAIPLTLLTGFLGAGKTTLLNRLVQSPAFSRTVVVINEFGDVAVDHLLVEQADGDLMTLSSGCVCCTVQGDLVALLEDLLRRRDNNRMAPFDRLVIETTGLAEPGPILNTIAHHPYLPLRYRMDGVITVVDALHGETTLDAHHEAVDQVAMADVLVLTKSDLAADTSALRDRLAQLAPRALLLDAAAGEATAEALLAAAERVSAGPTATPHHHHHHHHHGHDDIGSLVLTADRPLSPPAFEMFVDLLRGQQGARLLRAKGLVALDDGPDRPLVLHVVQGTLHPPRRLPAWPSGTTPPQTALVVIGRTLDEAAVRRLWEAFFGGPAIDRPDSAGLALSRHPGGPGLF